MKRHLIVQIILVTLFSLLQAQKDKFFCPNGLIATSACGNSMCPSGQVCLKKLVSTNRNHTKFSQLPFCCDQFVSFCPETKMSSFHTLQDGAYNWQYSTSLPAEHWYETKVLFSTNHTYSAACPVPRAYQLAIAHGKDSVAVGFKVGGKPVKTCSKTSDCKTGQFCGHAANPSFSLNNAPTAKDLSNRGAAFKFCFKDPTFSSKKYRVYKMAFGLQSCDKHSDCVEAIKDNDTFCETSKESQGISADGVQPLGKKMGFCVYGSVCSPNHVSLDGALAQGARSCDPKKLETCQGVGIDGRTPLDVFDPACVAAPGFKNVKLNLCCYSKPPPCSMPGAVAHTPVKSCSQYSDCADPKIESYKNGVWCDVKAKQCCKVIQRAPGETELLWQCPTRLVPLFNEPKCNQTFDGSFTCPMNPKFLCKHGHCCPENSLSPETTYVSKMSCDPATKVPEEMVGAYCEPELGVFVFVGRLSVHGEPVTMTQRACNINTDCGPGFVCAQFPLNKYICLYNPIDLHNRKPNTAWWYVLYISIACSIIFAIAAAVNFVCYRSKSFFDARKKKKSKNDNESETKSKVEESKSEVSAVTNPAT